MKARESLIEVRRELLDKLRAQDPYTVAELEQVDVALNALGGAPDAAISANREFMGMTVLQATETYLRRNGTEVSIPELTKVLLRGGVSLKAGKRSPEWKVAQSLGYHEGKKRLIIQEGMVSLPEWKTKNRSR